MTETKTSSPVFRSGRAVQIADGGISTYFLSTFGRATRETVCSCEVASGADAVAVAAPAQRRHDDAKDPGRQPHRPGLTEKKTPADIIDELFIRCLCRRPTAKEKARFDSILAAERDKKKALDDAFWCC